MKIDPHLTSIFQTPTIDMALDEPMSVEEQNLASIRSYAAEKSAEWQADIVKTLAALPPALRQRTLASIYSDYGLQFLNLHDQTTAEGQTRCSNSNQVPQTPTQHGHHVLSTPGVRRMMGVFRYGYSDLWIYSDIMWIYSDIQPSHSTIIYKPQPNPRRNAENIVVANPYSRPPGRPLWIYIPKIQHFNQPLRRIVNWISSRRTLPQKLTRFNKA